MTHILHISADFPDAYSVRKTSAVRNLIEGTPEFTHSVCAINRINGIGGVQVVSRDRSISTFVYQAPPYGILLETFLKPLAKRILHEVVAPSGRVDLIHAHKLTIEGVLAQHVAHAIGCPYVCSVRGNTDQKYIRLKPGMRRRWRQVAQQAAWLFPVTPWIDRYISQMLVLGEASRSLLPTVTGIDRILSPRDTGPRLVTAFHLAGWRMKGMPNLFAALTQLRATGLEVGLDILGSGSAHDTDELRREIRRHGLNDLVILRGAVPHEQMPEALNGYTAFVLPTLRETFGMVYIEALFSGIPILYSCDRGVDGFFDGQNVGVRCDPTSVADIADGLKTLLANTRVMKCDIAVLQAAGDFERFRQDTVCRDYAARIESIAL